MISVAYPWRTLHDTGEDELQIVTSRRSLHWRTKIWYTYLGWWRKGTGEEIYLYNSISLQHSLPHMDFVHKSTRARTHTHVHTHAHAHARTHAHTLMGYTWALAEIWKSTVSAWQTETGVYSRRLDQCKKRHVAPGIPCVWSECERYVNEQISGETGRECAAEEDQQDMEAQNPSWHHNRQ